MCPIRRNIRQVMTDRVRNSCTVYLVRNEIKCMTAPNEIIPNIISIKTIQSVADIKKNRIKYRITQSVFGLKRYQHYKKYVSS